MNLYFALIAKNQHCSAKVNDYLLHFDPFVKDTWGNCFALVPSKYSRLCIRERIFFEKQKMTVNPLQQGYSEVTDVKNVNLNA